MSSTNILRAATRNLSITAFLAASCFASVQIAHAEDAPAPDKSGYTLFHPTPTDQMRTWVTDRPTKVLGPNTIDAGHISIESDAFNYVWDSSSPSGAHTRVITTFDPTVRVGLTNSTELALVFAGWSDIYSVGASGSGVTSASGLGDLYLRLKWNLFGNDGGDYSFAVMPYIKLPTAEKTYALAAGLNNEVEGGVVNSLGFTLPADFAVTLQAQLDFLKNGADTGSHLNFQGIINVGHTVPGWDEATAYVELYNQSTESNNQSPIWTADFALAWLVNDTFQLDAGVNLGLNKAAADFNPYIGLSKRF
jgi:hypothetical protein